MRQAIGRAGEMERIFEKDGDYLLRVAIERSKVMTPNGATQ